MDKNFFKYEQRNQNNNENEKFSSLKQFDKKVEDIDYCSNPVYKSVVFLILAGIIIFFIWFVSRKRYFEDNEYNDTLVSTPFK